MKHARYLHNPLSRLLGLLLVLLFASFTLSAQDECDNNCIGALDQPLNVTLNMTCDATILTSMVVPDLDACPGPKNLVVRDSLNHLLGQGVDAVPIEGDTLVGRRVSVTITDQATGSVCVGYIRLFDNASPTISECPEVTISCLEDASPAALGTPTVTDNCHTTLSPSFIDNVILRDCLSDTAAVILRQWTADDGHGQSVACTQRINILRASAMSVAFPRDVVLPCDNPNASPDSTGVPLLNGMPLMHGDLCGLEVSYLDDTTYICQDYMFRIDREWTVTESCTDFSETSTQVILISDHVGPTLTCPTPTQMIFSSDPDDCAATVTLPQPTAVDNCGSNITFQVTTSYGASGFDPVSGIMPGTYQVNYFATDECGNPSSCSTTLTVIDDVQPTASCDDLVNVSLSSNGVAILSASAFDEGSSDNCASPVFVKARRAAVGECSGMNGDDSNQFGFQEWFDDRVVFCCDDAIGNVQVSLRVYEVNPGTGPVDPSRETGDGDLAGHFTECTSMVQIQDSQGPRFSACPADLTVQCTDELEDVTIYGSPNVIADNCGAALTVDSTVTRTLNECRQGTIVRRWIVSNPDNQRATCVQTITVDNNEILPESAITWPLDYETTECGADLSLENLPAEYREPVVNWDGCGTVAMNMTESYFDRSAPACFKILRTWTIIDWCHYEQGADIPVGRYQHTQQLKVIDNVAPTITCPAPVEVNVSANCTTGEVVLDAPEVTDCAGQVTITNNSPFADDNGPLANGDYPVGTHTVRFLATDGCGLTTACTTSVRVHDMQPPTVSCNGGLTVSLMPMPEGGAGGSLPAIDFVASALDNCDPVSLLKYSVRHADDNSIGVPTATEVFFDCGELAEPQLIEVFVRDNNNNAASCTSLVTVQENNGACQGQSSAMGMIAGAVITEDGVEVENVTVRVAGNSPIMQYTGIDGSFRFDDLPAGDDYTIMPEMNEDLLNGVTTMDIVLMSKHIIGTRPLSSPYKIIAADIDRSGHVSTLDIIRLRKLILRIDNAFPNNNTAWRFIDASYEFADPTNPFLGYFPEVYNVNDLGGEEMHADFIAIKVGDVNGSARANSFQAPGGRNLPQGLVLKVENQALGLDEVVEIPVRARYMNEWSGYQFTLEFNPSSLEVFEIVPGELPNLYAEENFNLFDLESGLITTIWHEFDEMADGREMTLFSLRCRAKQPVEIKDALYLSSRVTTAEAVSQEGETGDVSISFNSSITENGTTFELYQNRPNPWTNSTIIPFELDPGGDASLTIYDMAGKQVYRTDGNYTSGYHEISVSRYDLPAVGLFYYTLESGDQRATRKMVLTD